MNKKFKILLGVFSIMIFSFSFAKSLSADATLPDKLNLTIVNKISEGSLPVSGVEYTLYNGTDAITQFEAKMKAAGDTFANNEELFKEFSSRIKNNDPDILNSLHLAANYIAVATTDNDGKAKFVGLTNDDPSKGIARKFYVALQTNSHSSLSYPIIFSTPLEKSDIEIQAKGEILPRPPVPFYKWGTDNEEDYNKPYNKELYHSLANAGFVIYKEDDKGIQKWLANDGSWQDTDENAQVFLSSAGDGLVDISTAKLPAGTYYAEEQQAPDGVDVNKNGTIDDDELWGPTVESEKVKIEIPADLKKPVLINGIDTTKEKVKIFNLLGHNQLPDTDEPDDGNREALPDTGKTGDNGLRDVLPDTGEIISFATGLIGGAMIMFAFLVFIKQRKEVEVKEKK